LAALTAASAPFAGVAGGAAAAGALAAAGRAADAAGAAAGGVDGLLEAVMGGEAGVTGVLRDVGLAMAGKGQGEGVGFGGGGRLAVRLPEIDDSADRQIGVHLGVAAGEACRGATGGEDPVAR